MKKIMERRLLSLILAVVLMLSLLPAGVLAADAETVRIEDSDSAVSWSAEWKTWTYDASSGATTHYANDVGASVTVPFEGTQITVYGQKSFNGPIMTASVDGGTSHDADFYGNDSSGNEQQIISITGLTSGEHTLTMQFTDRHNEGAKASSAGLYQAQINYFVSVDEGTQEEPTEYFDGAVYDEWEQDAATVFGTGAACELKDGKRHLKAGSGNANGNPYPAVFINKTMSDALAKLGDEETAFLETTLESYNAGSDTRYGVYLNYDGPNAAFFVGADAAGWFWQILDGNENPWYQGTRVPISAAGEKAVLRLEWKGTTLTKATVNGENLFADMPLDFSAAAGNETAKGVIGFKAAKYSSAITEYDVSGLRYSGQTGVKAYAVSGTVTDTDGNAVAGAAVTVRELAGVSAVTSRSGKFTLRGVPNGEYTLDAVCDGYQDAFTKATVQDGNVEKLRISMTPEAVETFTLHTDKMDVIVDQAFPRVLRYEMLGELAGKRFEGQSRVLSTIEINKEKLTPVVTSQMDGERAVNYTMHVESGELSADIRARLEADGNVLTFTITDVSYPNSNRLEHPVESIFIPEHSLISVNSTQTDAKVKAATLASSTISSGDSDYTVDESLKVSSVNGRSFRYVFLSNDELSAGISGNSDIGGLAASDNNRLTLSAVQQGEKRTVGAGSNLWFYDRKVSSSDAAQAAYANLTDEQKVVGIREGLDEQPYVKVVITGDENGDKSVDWQDGAIAARDQKVIHIPYASESIPDLVTTRIAMNFQSQATNPFLTSLDNVKRVALHSDGLGQSILLKGYANEGHDSGHPDYFDIGTRMGGAEDMKTMLVEGQKYGAEFGIHVNASEFYPEAKSFNEDMVKRSGSSLSYGWNWLDQGIGINGIYDLASENRNERFDKLYEIVGDELDYVYVDVWGNGTSGSEDAWQTRKLSNEITRNQWRIVHEWGYANDWDSTFQHWVSDFTYGGYDNKGKYNSEVFRFLLNGSKDSFPPDFPTYGGAANAPLLGGAVMQGFEGWQGDVEYDLFIKTLYNQMLPAKFLQHYNIMKWVDSPNAVSIPYGTYSGGFSWNQKSSWTPEAQITLQSSDRTDTIVVTRGSDAEVNEAYAYGTEAEQLEYRSRYMTLNGRVILTGASDPGDFTSNAVDGNLKYLIPWYWDCNGNRLSAQEEKLYHYSLTGGESSWQLPEGWESLQTIKIFKLTDTGRTDEQTVSVNNGWVTLSAEADTPYVVVKGENGAKAPVVSWTAKGMHLSDVSFNGALEENWTAEGTASVVSTDHEIRMLKLSGESSVRQQLTDLKAGTSYAIYVGVDNRSDAKASIAVLDSAGSTVVSNYTLRSLGKNYVNSDIHRNGHSTEAGTSYFQNMYLFFTPEAGQTYTLVLSREAGSGNTYFDDVRVVENASQNFTYDDDGNVTAFTQDFEHVAQGIYPFVIGPAQGVNDGRTHLSELHAPYTQAGWDVKKMDDVLGGNWSVKINGLTQHNGIIYYTIPQNFHFEAGKTYTVSFQYQMGSEGTYEVVYGSGEYTSATLNVVPLKKSLGETATCTFTMIGDESGQSWFGIRSTSKAADTQGTSGAAANFGGYSDFVLDDLSIRLSSAQKKALSELVQEAEEYAEEDYEGDWAAFERALEEAKDVLADPNATQDEVDAAAAALEAAMNALRRYQTALKVTVMDENGKTLSGAALILEDESYMPTGSRGESDGSGVYTFTGLKARAYQLKVVCSGYDVTTAAVETLTADQTKQITVTLHKQQAATYTNDYNTGDVSMMKPMDGNAGGGQSETIETVDFDGSGALKVTYQNYERNTVVDENAVLQNGTVEFDVTPLVSGVRFGLTLRGKDLNNRIYVGPFDNSSTYGWNCFVGGEEAWSDEFAGPQLAKDVTRHYKVTLHDSSLSLWIDGVLVFENETISSNPTEAGFVGFNAGRNQGTQFIFDNLRIISDEPGAVTPVTGVTVEPERLALKAGETMRLEAKVKPQNATNRNVRWESSDPLVAVVDKNGVVTAVGEGTVLVKVTTEDGAFTAVCSITVNKADCMHNGGTEIRGAIEATILADGYTGDVYCVLCGALLEKGHVIPRRLNDLVGIIMGSSDDFPFRDVSQHTWYYESVYKAWSNGLIDGVTATEFKPDNQLTVAQAIKLAAALHQMQKTGSVTLTSGSPNWYDSYVAYAVNNGVIEKDYLNYTKAQMNAPATRGEFVHIFSGALLDAAAINTVTDNKIPDVKTTDKYGAEIYTFYRAGITVGSDAAGTFRPASSIKRSEVAAILQRMYDTAARKSISLN